MTSEVVRLTAGQVADELGDGLRRLELVIGRLIDVVVDAHVRQRRHQVGLGAAVDLGVGRDHPHEQGRSRPRRADEEDELVLHERS